MFFVFLNQPSHKKLKFNFKFLFEKLFHIYYDPQENGCKIIICASIQHDQQPSPGGMFDVEQLYTFHRKARIELRLEKISLMLLITISLMNKIKSFFCESMYHN